MRRESIVALVLLAVVAAFIGLVAHRLLGPLSPFSTRPDELPESYKIRVAEEGPPLSSEEEAYQRVYQIASAGVVQITTRRYTRTFFGVVPEEGMGSGFVANEAGIILTNYHVVQGANWVEVGFTDGTRAEAQWFRADPSLDLAIVKIDPAGRKLHPLTFGHSSRLQIGQRVVAIGNPFGLSGTLTVGVVSALGRDIRTEEGKVIEDVIQTDASINPGNSGGPLLNLAGQVIGMNTAIFSPTGGSVGIGFAVAIDKIQAVLPRLIESETAATRGWLGITTRDARGAGAQIVHVLPDSPAARAGLRAGHVIVALDGEPIASSEELIRRVAQFPPGRKLQLDVLDPESERRGRVDVELGKRLD